MKFFDYFFLKISLLIITAFCLIFLFYNVNFISFAFLKASILAGIITYFNFVLGYCAIRFSNGKSLNTLMIVIFGGMILRLFMLLLLVFISLKFLDISTGIFIFIILFFYVFYLLMEILYLSKKDNLRKN
jgi:hypothetical protein